MEPRALTVSALTKYIKAKLEGDQHLKSFYLEAEISNFTHHSSGHLYFTLKDQNAQIKAMMFASSAKTLLFKPSSGDKVTVYGSISLYEPRGEYSVVVYQMKQQGLGKLYEEYEKLKKHYEDLGYFSDSLKKQIPKFPKTIGVVTSPTGAVIEDIKNTVGRRYPNAKIVLYPAKVQGEGASKTISDQINKANILNEVDVLIVGRGGGSIEDLWPFNEVLTIEAIINSKIPIIAAIGHETDYTISDFVADLRSPTPTAAAEQATPNRYDLIEDIRKKQIDIINRYEDLLEMHRRNLLNMDQRLSLLSPQNKLKGYVDQVNNLSNQLKSKINIIYLNKQKEYNQSAKLINVLYERVINKQKQDFLSLTEKLKGLNPLNYLEKGFALTKHNEKIITSIEKININDELKITYRDGSIMTKVIKKETL